MIFYYIYLIKYMGSKNVSLRLLGFQLTLSTQTLGHLAGYARTFARTFCLFHLKSQGIYTGMPWHSPVLFALFTSNPRAFTRVRPGIRPSFLTRQLKIEALLLLKNIENKNSK